MINITTPQEITKIYLVTNCFGDPNKVYIGKTISSKNYRKNKHKKNFGEQINFTYIDEVNSLDKDIWIPLEKFWIEYFRQLGFDLQNKNKGGAGLDQVSLKTREKMKANKPNKKSILQYDLEGNFIKEWESLSEASRLLKLNINSISSCCKSKTKRVGKFIFREKQNFINFKIKPYNNSKKSKIPNYIIQLDLEDNKLREWISTKEAANNLNIRKCCITACCIGIQKTAGGYKWKYK